MFLRGGPPMNRICSPLRTGLDGQALSMFLCTDFSADVNSPQDSIQKTMLGPSSPGILCNFVLASSLRTLTFSLSKRKEGKKKWQRIGEGGSERGRGPNTMGKRRKIWVLWTQSLEMTKIPLRSGSSLLFQGSPAP